MKKNTVNQAREIHKQNMVLLSYVNPSMSFLPDGNLDFSCFFNETKSNWNFNRAKRGGVNVMIASMGFGSGSEVFPGKAGVGRQFQVLSNFISEVDKKKKQVEIATNYTDIKRIVSQNKMALLLHLTGVCLDGDLAVLHGLYELGLRSIHPPFDNRDPDADHVEGEKGGLTKFGEKVVEKMNELGMIVDVAHCSDTSFWQIMKMARQPVIDSHANCRKLCRVSRNLTDRQIEAIAENGGAIGIHFSSGFIDKSFIDRFRATGFYEKLRVWEKQLQRKYKDPFKYLCERINPKKWEKSPLYKIEQSIVPPPLGLLVDHVDHLVKIGGVDHVGVGTDYDLGTIPKEVDTADKLPTLTVALRGRGYSKQNLKKILSDNFLRVIKKVI